MCFAPKMPKMPEQKDPILPKQPLAPQQPVGLSVGRTEETDQFKNAKAKRSRGKLRIMSDSAGVQVSGAPPSA
jgi:hypothetical protein